MLSCRNTISAAAVVAAVCPAWALTPVQIEVARSAGTLKEIHLVGASSQRLLIATWFRQQCRTTGSSNTFDVYFSGVGTNPGGANHRAYACELARKVGNWPAGTPVLLTKRDVNDSEIAMQPIARGLPVGRMVVDSTCVATGKPSPATAIRTAGYACAGVRDGLADAGISDVEPSLLQRPPNLPAGLTALSNAELDDLDKGTLIQTNYGVAVNKKAYRALQISQGLLDASDPFDDSAQKRPRLPRSFVAAAFSGQLSGSSSLTPGWTKAISSAVYGPVAEKQVNVCRMSVGSGLQAASNAFFLGVPNASTGFGYFPAGQTLSPDGLTSVDSPVRAIAAVGNFAVSLAESTWGVENCLRERIENAAGGAFGLAIVSLENDPIASGGSADPGYRFVNVDGVPYERSAIQVGSGHDFVYNTVMQWSGTRLIDADKLAFLKTMRNGVGTATTLRAADRAVQDGYLVSPLRYAGLYEDLVDADLRQFASTVDRPVRSSLSPLRVVK